MIDIKFFDETLDEIPLPNGIVDCIWQECDDEFPEYLTVQTECDCALFKLHSSLLNKKQKAYSFARYIVIKKDKHLFIRFPE